MHFRSWKQTTLALTAGAPTCQLSPPGDKGDNTTHTHASWDQTKGHRVSCPAMAQVPLNFAPGALHRLPKGLVLTNSKAGVQPAAGLYR